MPWWMKKGMVVKAVVSRPPCWLLKETAKVASVYGRSTEYDDSMKETHEAVEV